MSNDTIMVNGEPHEVKDSSKDQYQNLLESGELGDQEKEVLEALDRVPYICTRNELKHEELDDWEKSTISGRVNGLIDEDLVEVVGKREDQYADHNVSVEVLMITGRGEKVLEEIR